MARALRVIIRTAHIDLCLYGGEGLTLNVLYQINREIDSLLLPYTIDLSIFAQLTNPDFTEHIQRVGVVFDARKQLQA